MYFNTKKLTTSHISPIRTKKFKIIPRDGSNYKNYIPTSKIINFSKTNRDI